MSMMKESEWFVGLMQSIEDHIEKDRPLVTDSFDQRMARKVYMKLKEMEEGECPDA